MPLTLSLNTNPLVNRFADPDDLIETVARDMRIRDLQLTHEFINPSWPTPITQRLTKTMMAALARIGVRVTSGMTGPYGRLNHFCHPDAEVRRYYVEWLKTFADITANLGGTSVGTLFAIFTYRDYDEPSRRVPCLYGGSVNPDNCEELIRRPHVDGLFIGRSALNAAGYLDILERCTTTLGK